MAILSLLLRSLTYTKQAELVTMNNWSAYSINLSKKINTPNSLSFNIPADAPHYEKIIVGASLIEFEEEIYIVRSNKITKEDKSIAEISCEHLSSNLAYIRGSYYEYQAEKVSTLVNEVLKNTNWKLGETDIADSNLRHLISSNETVLANLLMIAENFGAVCTFTANSDGVNKVNFYVNKKERGFYITNTKNLQAFTLNYDTTDLVTRLWAWGSINKNTGIQTNILSLTDNKGYIEDYSFYTKQGYSIEYIQSHPELFLMETEMTLDDVSDEKALYDLAIKELDKRKNPKTILNVNVLDLSQVPKYFMEKPDIYENAVLIDETLNLKLEATITGFNKNYDDDLNMGLDISDTIEYSNFMKDIIDKVDKADTAIKDIDMGWKDVIDEAKNTATDIINGGLKDSYVVVRQNEILIMNTTDPETCTSLWRWNRGGLGYSANGYHGQFSTAITNDGAINADFISVGSLQAEIIKTGILSSLNGATWINMDNGTFSFADGKVRFDGSKVEVEALTEFKDEIKENNINNLIPNSAFKNGLWGSVATTNVQSIDSRVIDNASSTSGKAWHIYCSQGASQKATALMSTDFELNAPSGEYSFGFWVQRFSGSAEITIEFWDNKENWNYITYTSLNVTNEYNKRLDKTFTLPSNSKYARITISCEGWVNIGQEALQFNFSDFILNKGTIAQQWSPHSSELYEGITSINKDGVKVSMNNGEGLQGYSKTSYDGFSIYDSNDNRKAWFGESNSAYIQSLQADEIVNDKLVKWGKGRPTQFYISTTSTGDGTGRDTKNKSNSINHTLRWIEKNYGKYSVDQNIQFWIDNGKFYEDILLIGWIGSGTITFDFDNESAIYGNHIIKSNTMPIHISGRRTNKGENINSGCYFIDKSKNKLFYIENSNVILTDVRSNPDAFSGSFASTFLQVNNNATVYIENCDIVGYHLLYSTNHNSIVTSSKVRGLVDWMCHNYTGGVTKIVNYIPVNNSLQYNTNGGQLIDIGTITNENSLFYDSGSTPPSHVWQWFENSFALSDLRTNPEGSGSSTSSRNGEWGQGSWGGYQSHRGYADMGDSPSSWASGGRNFTVELTLTRSNTSHGNAGATPVPKLKLPNGSYWNCGVGFARGQTSTVTLPSELGGAIASGSIKTLEMWAGNSNNDYSFYNYSSIKIRCEKQV